LNARANSENHTPDIAALVLVFTPTCNLSMKLQLSPTDNPYLEHVHAASPKLLSATWTSRVFDFKVGECGECLRQEGEVVQLSFPITWPSNELCELSAKKKWPCDDLACPDLGCINVTILSS
jgi:hypothetical protein